VDGVEWCGVDGSAGAKWRALVNAAMNLQVP
jgi:hypothetical protein